VTQQWCSDYNRRVQVLIVRRLEATKHTLGVGFDTLTGKVEDGSWFVYDRQDEEGIWHKHCGPYSDMEQGVDWINAIREGPVEQPGVAGSTI
jgi:hypothetical protein